MENFTNVIAGFNNSTSNINTLYSKKHKLADIISKDEFKKFIKDAHEDCDYLFSNKDDVNHIKIDYIYGEDLIKAAQLNNIEIKHVKGNSRKKRFYKNNKCFIELGTGSVNKISTKQQEDMTVYIWNKFVEILRNPIDNTSNVDLDGFIEDLSAELSVFDKSWQISFKTQLKSLYNYLKSLGVNPIEYNMVRQGEENIGKAYYNMLKSYLKDSDIKKSAYKNVNAIDPTDVILYKKSAENEITEFLNNNRTEYIKNYKETLYNPHLCIGVSLKKLGKKEVKAQEFNSGKAIIKKIISAEPVIAGEGAKIKVIIVNNEDIEIPVDLVLRKFQGQASLMPDIDCIGTGSYSLGKCPRGRWMTKLNPQGKTYDELKKSFMKLASDKEYDIILDMIKGSIKEGDLCFSFIKLA